YTTLVRSARGREGLRLFRRGEAGARARQPGAQRDRGDGGRRHVDLGGAPARRRARLRGPRHGSRHPRWHREHALHALRDARQEDRDRPRPRQRQEDRRRTWRPDRRQLVAARKMLYDATTQRLRAGRIPSERGPEEHAIPMTDQLKLPLLAAHDEALQKCVYCPKLCRTACPVSNVEATETVTPWGKMSLAYFAAR